MNEHTTFNRLIRTPTDEFIQKWGDTKQYLPISYIEEFIQFIKFCKENKWDILDGVVVISEKYYTDEKNKADEKLKKIKDYSASSSDT